MLVVETLDYVSFLFLLESNKTYYKECAHIRNKSFSDDNYLTVYTKEMEAITTATTTAIATAVVIFIITMFCYSLRLFIFSYECFCTLVLVF
jgi:hypothetical protein